MSTLEHVYRNVDKAIYVLITAIPKIEEVIADLDKIAANVESATAAGTDAATAAVESGNTDVKAAREKMVQILKLVKHAEKKCSNAAYGPDADL